MRYGLALIVSLLATACLATTATAASTTTLQRTIQDCDGNNVLEYTFGERYTPFPQSPPEESEEEGCVRVDGERLALPRDASILNFLQLSDFQIVDEESPARVEWLDATQRIPGLAPFSAAYRPQESLTTQVTEAMVRQARNTISPVTSEELELTILTGDNADSQQYNETRWFIDILDGTTTPVDPDPEDEVPPDANRDEKLDPNSGVPTSACGATPGSIYDGVRDSGQSGVFPDGGYYEPDSSSGENDDGDGYSPDPEENFEETPGRNVTVRDFPGLFEDANQPFEALGLDMPWYSAFGNHDALVQGNSPDAYVGPFGAVPDEGPPHEVYDPVYDEVATGCVKVMQPAASAIDAITPLVEQIQQLRDEGVTEPEQEEIDDLTAAVLGIAQDALLDPCDPDDPADEGCEVETVPPDERRCFLAKDEPDLPSPGSPCESGTWIGQHFRTTGTPVGHGFALAPGLPLAKQGSFCEDNPTDPDCLAASYGRPLEAQLNNDGYYSFTPRPGLRFAVLDTVTDECGTVFCSEGSVDHAQFQWLERQITTAEVNGEYVVVFSHHTLRTTRFESDDPSEQPLHFGQRVDRRGGQPQNQTGGETLEELYCQHANVLAHVAGHEHENYVERHDCADDEPPPPVCVPAATCPNPHFWHISTAAHIDWPQQSRMIELVNIDGEMSFVLTMLDHLGAANPGGAPQQSDQGHAPSDVQRLASIGREIAYNDYQGSRGARGARHDRNVILPTDRPPPPFGG